MVAMEHTNTQRAEQHPQAVDPNLIKCPVGESGNVSFLTHILQGKSQYGCDHSGWQCYNDAILTGECTSDEAKSSVPADMRSATEGNKYSTFDATVDGYA